MLRFESFGELTGNVFRGADPSAESGVSWQACQARKREVNARRILKLEFTSGGASSCEVSRESPDWPPVMWQVEQKLNIFGSSSCKIPKRPGRGASWNSWTHERKLL